MVAVVVKVSKLPKSNYPLVYLLRHLCIVIYIYIYIYKGGRGAGRKKKGLKTKPLASKAPSLNDEAWLSVILIQ